MLFWGLNHICLHEGHLLDDSRGVLVVHHVVEVLLFKKFRFMSHASSQDLFANSDFIAIYCFLMIHQLFFLDILDFIYVFPAFPCSSVLHKYT